MDMRHQTMQTVAADFRQREETRESTTSRVYQKELFSILIVLYFVTMVSQLIHANFFHAIKILSAPTPTPAVGSFS